MTYKMSYSEAVLCFVSRWSLWRKSGEVNDKGGGGGFMRMLPRKRFDVSQGRTFFVHLKGVDPVKIDFN